jgi:hypothetical protein
MLNGSGSETKRLSYLTICMFQLNNCWMDFDEILYKCCAVECHLRFTLFKFVQYIPATWQIIEFMRVTVAQGTNYGNDGNHRKLNSSNNNNFGNNKQKNHISGLGSLRKSTYSPV